MHEKFRGSKPRIEGILHETFGGGLATVFGEMRQGAIQETVWDTATGHGLLAHCAQREKKAEEKREKQ